MVFSPLSSDQVLEFMHLNTWTEIILFESKPDKNGLHIATTEEKRKIYLRDKERISLQSDSYLKIEKFKVNELVAVKIKGDWFRGKLISHNEYKSNDTRIELIDVGSFFETKLQNLFVLPYYFGYDPLAIPIKFKNFIPKSTKVTVKPLLSESELHEGFVLVDVNIVTDDTKNETPKSDIKKDSSFSCDSKVTCNQNITNGDDYLISSLNRDCLISQKKKKDIPLKNGDYCFIKLFEDFSCLYLSKAVKNNITNNYELCDGSILETLNRDKIPKTHPVVGEIVKALSTQYEDIYRAKILQNNYDGTYNVFYIDYGNIETVPLSQIYEISDDLKKPAEAVKVELKSLKENKCTEKVKTLFNDFALKETPFIIELDETSENCLQEVTLKDLNGLNIKSYINTEHNGTIKQGEKKSLVDNDCNGLKNNDVVFLKHFNDMASIYIIKNVQLFNYVYVELNHDQSKIKKYQFREGDIVKIITEHSTYRAKIKKVHENSIHVENIDIGFCNVVSSDSIYELPDKLSKIPGLALKIGVKEPSVNNSEALQNFIRSVEKIPLYLDFDESRGYQEMTLRRQSNSKNIFVEFLESMKEKDVCNGISDSCINKGMKSKENENSIIDFQPITLENGDYCFISYFKDFNNIYLSKAIKNPTNDGPPYEIHNFDIISKTMLSKDQKPKTNVGVGDIVKVISPIEESFYRAKVLNIENNDDILVFYFDFGNTEIVCLNNIFELSDELSIKTELPISVSMKVPANAKVTTEIENFFSDLPIEPFSIEYNKNSINGVENVLLKELNSGTYLNDKVLSLLPVEVMSIKNFDCVILTYFENFNCLYVSKALESENNQFLSDIRNSTDRKIKTNPNTGDIVKVFSPLFQYFVRAKIISCQDNGYQVFYMDLGNTEFVQSSDIFELKDNFKRKTGLAIEIGISIPCEVKINKEISDFFSTLIKKSDPITIEFDESSDVGLKNCILKVISTSLIINYEVSKLFENYCMASFKKVENVESHIGKGNQSLNDIHNKIKCHLLKNGETVYLIYFHTSTSIFVVSENDYDEYLNVAECVAVDDSKIQKLNIEVGDIVKAMFEGIFYRAKVLRKLNQSSFCISFIDYGNEKIVNADEIYELSDELKKIPEFAIKIGIKGPPIIEETEKKIVSEYFVNKESDLFYIEFDENNPNGLSEATLKDKNNCDVFNEIYKLIGKPLIMKENPVQISQNGTTLINSSESESIKNIKLKNGDIVFCTHFENFDHIYLCKGKGSKSDVIPENYSVIIDASKVKDLTVKKNPECGEIIRVKYEEKIYRGKVFDKLGDRYTIFLIDIGKNIPVSVDKMFEISNNLKNIPCLAQKVGLHVPTNFIITKIVKDYFDNLWYNEPVPLILIYDDSNLNCLNEVSLKKLSNGKYIVEDLLKNYNTSNNNPNKLKPVTQNQKINGNGSTQWCHILSGKNVEFLYGNNTDNIYIREKKLFEDYRNIIEEFRKGKIENFETINPKPNEIAAVYSTKHNGLYRAKVIGPSAEDISNFRCVFSDFSHVESIPSKYIFEIPKTSSISKVPYMSHKVSLAGLTKMTNNSKLVNYLSSLVGKTYVLEYDDKRNERWYKDVTLKELKSNVSLNEEIRRLFFGNNSSMSQQRRLERKIISPDLQPTESELEKPVHPIKSGSRILITNFENFDSIFIRDASYEFLESFNEFNRKMMKYFRRAINDNSTKQSFCIGDKVCVSSELNLVSYSRAQIVEKINNQYKVFYFDFGNVELVDSDVIFELPKELEMPQNFVIKVKLQNIRPLTQENEIKVVKDYFKKKIITSNTQMIIEFNELNAKGLDDVVLKTEYYKKDIVNELKSLLNQPPLSIKSTEQSQNTVSHIMSDTTIAPNPARRHYK